MGEPAVRGPAAGRAETVPVDFAGDRSGQAPLTWGQRAIWNAMCRAAPNDVYYNIARLLRLDDRGRPVGLPQVTAGVAALLARHESLRTRLRAPGGAPYQEVARRGRLELTVVDAPDREQAPRAAGDLLARLAGTRFDYEGEWPLRVGVVRCGEQVTHVAVAVCHLSSDGQGAEVLVRDLRLLIRRGSAGRPPATAPLDLAREQHGPSGRRRSAAALARWEHFYRTIPPSMFPHPVAPPRRPAFWTGRLRSAALAQATGVLAAAHRVSSTTVLLAGASALLAADGGHPVAAVMPIVGNRTADAHRDLVAMLSQDSMFLLGLAECGPGARFTDLLPAAWRAAMAGYRASAYDPVAWEELRERVGRERGTEVHPYCCFNDQRFFERPAPEGPPPGAAALREAQRRTVFDFPETQDRLSCRYCVHVHEDADGLVVWLTAHTAYLPPAGIRAHLEALENLLVASACGDSPRLAELPGLLRREM